MRILLVEDDIVIGKLIDNHLKSDLYTVDWVKTYSEGQTAIMGHVYSAIVLDLMLPDGSGERLLKHVRSNAASSSIGIIILTGKTDISDRVNYLNAGADDYITKPFNIQELSARIKSVIRRAFNNTDPVVKKGDIEINFAQRLVKRSDKNISLTPREFALLRLLIEKRGRILSRTQIEEQMYGWGMEIESNTVEVYVHHLRKKLGRDLIKTIRSVGYTITKN